jgi:hypothetical protein
LELLKEIAPWVTRAAVLRDPTLPQGAGQFGAIQSVAPSFGVELRPIDVHDAGEIEHAVAAFSSASNGGPEAAPPLFRLLLLTQPLDLLRDLLVLFRHLREAVLPQLLRSAPVPIRRVLAQLLAIVLGRHPFAASHFVMTVIAVRLDFSPSGP